MYSLCAIFYPKTKGLKFLRQQLKKTLRFIGPFLVFMVFSLLTYVITHHIYGIFNIFRKSHYLPLHLFITLYFTFNIYYSFLKTVFRNVKMKKSQVDQDEDLLFETDDINHCSKCNVLRIDDTIHHCSICKHCIDGMDHHCPWVNNCIGRRNRGYFLSFLLQLFLGLLYSISTFYYNFEQIDDITLDQISNTLLIEFCFSIAILLFGTWSWYLLLSGQTTITFKRQLKRRQFTWKQIFGQARKSRILLSPLFIDVQ